MMCLLELPGGERISPNGCLSGQNRSIRCQERSGDAALAAIGRGSCVPIRHVWRSKQLDIGRRAEHSGQHHNSWTGFLPGHKGIRNPSGSFAACLRHTTLERKWVEDSLSCAEEELASHSGLLFGARSRRRFAGRRRLEPLHAAISTRKKNARSCCWLHLLPNLQYGKTAHVTVTNVKFRLRDRYSLPHPSA